MKVYLILNLHHTCQIPHLKKSDHNTNSELATIDSDYIPESDEGNNF